MRFGTGGGCGEATAARSCGGGDGTVAIEAADEGDRGRAEMVERVVRDIISVADEMDSPFAAES